jgi:hypothetical protein
MNIPGSTESDEASQKYSLTDDCEPLQFNFKSLSPWYFY